LEAGASSWTLSRKPLSIPNSGIHGQWKRLVNEKKQIALGGRTSEIGKSTDTTRMPPLKGNAIGISNVLFSCKTLDIRSGRSKV
jgi:hypothetical protein